MQTTIPDALDNPRRGESRTFAYRLKLADADALDGVLAETGETASDLARRLVRVHLDAMTN